MMKFDYNFEECKICSNQIVWNDNQKRVGTCPNRCCTYDVDHQGETVMIYIFKNLYHSNGEDVFLIPLHKNNALINRISVLDKDLIKFLKRIEYWKENDRYLAEILSR